MSEGNGREEGVLGTVEKMESTATGNRGPRRQGRQTGPQ